MIKEEKNFKRKEIFDHYQKADNPFIISTNKIDVTNIVEFCEKHRHFYATLGFIITKTSNQIDAFKYRYKDGKIYYCDELKSNYTQMHEDETIGYFDLPPTNDYNEYIDNFIKIQDKFWKDKEYLTDNDLDEIWLSCEPWFSFTSFIPPFNKEITIPQFIWDKYEEEDESYYIHLMTMVHHGFADGLHIGKFLDLLKINIENFN